MVCLSVATGVSGRCDTDAYTVMPAQWAVSWYYLALSTPDGVGPEAKLP